MFLIELQDVSSSWTASPANRKLPITAKISHDIPLDSRRIILCNDQPPGDIVMLTAAVRDLHRAHPGRFLTDVRTPSPAIWENNPYVTPLEEGAAGVETIDCHYPLINRVNRAPVHFLHGFIDFLNKRLDLKIEPTEFKGDIHLSAREKAMPSQVAELTGEDVPFWLIGAGGKFDFTVKWWDTERYQAVVDQLKGRVLFVQVGAPGDHHPPLDGVLDLRGKTDLRQLIRLVYRAQGVLCPVTLLMHLAAAVETRPGRPKNRACVVVAGGREPMHWTAYPHHQFLHTGGMLKCCEQGGCWRSRTVPLGDGDTRDKPEQLCLDVVMLRGHERQSLGSAGAARITSPAEDVRYLPRCMDMIGVEDVVRAVERYFEGGLVREGEGENFQRSFRRAQGLAATPNFQRSMREREAAAFDRRRAAPGEPERSQARRWTASGRSDSECEAAETLASSEHRLRVDDGGLRLVRFSLTSGKLSRGASDAETFWDLREIEGQPRLEFSSVAGVTAHLWREEDGIWRGGLPGDGRPQSMELIPQPARFGVAPMRGPRARARRASVTQLPAPEAEAEARARLFPQNFPKIIHLVDIAQALATCDVESLRRQWLRLHPGWEFRVWTGCEAKALLRADEQPGPIARCGGFLRYLIARQQGGLCVSARCLPLKNIDSLLALVATSAFAGIAPESPRYERPLSAEIIGAAPGALFPARVIAGTKSHAASEADFSNRLTQLAAMDDSITIFPRHLFHPNPAEHHVAFMAVKAEARKDPDQIDQPPVGAPDRRRASRPHERDHNAKLDSWQMPSARQPRVFVPARPQSYPSHRLGMRQIVLPEERAFNGSLVETEAALLLVYRTDPILAAAFLDENLAVIPDTHQPIPLHHNDDPRLCSHHGRVYLSTSYHGSGLDQERIELRRLIMEDRDVAARDVGKFDHIENDPTYVRAREKNWAPFSFEDRLLYVHTAKPHRILEVNIPQGTVRLAHETAWKLPPDWRREWGHEPRLNSPPVRVAEEFFLSTMHTYCHGYWTWFYTFSAQPPFAVLAVSRQPVLTPHDAVGAQPVRDRRGGCLFITGLNVRNRSGEVLLTGGNNDASVIVISLELEEVLADLQPCVS